MLLIRNSQLQVLANEALALQLAAEFRSKYDNLITPEARGQLVSFVRDAILQAQEHGLSWESSLASFTLLASMFGPGFVAEPPFADIWLWASIDRDAQWNGLMQRLAPEHMLEGWRPLATR